MAASEARGPVDPDSALGLQQPGETLPLGKQTGRPVGPRIAGAAASPQGREDSSPVAQDDGLAASHPHFPARGFCSATSASSADPPVSSMPYDAAQRLQKVPRVPARLLPPKPLETICVQVQPEQKKEKERSELSLAAIQRSKNVTMNQPFEKNSRIVALSVINPHIATMPRSQQFLLYKSSEPTLQLLLQRPLHPLGQVSSGKITHELLNGLAVNGQKNISVAIAASDSPNVTRTPSCSANSLTNHEKYKYRVKKSLKVKTRSGRISRPPKYKAKDYKFIKTKDLADCHQSDSDDYAELSLEDDEGGGKEKEVCSLFGPLNYDLKPKLFKCQSCEKSYIGKGGLARHYKLNPAHRQEESSQSSINRQLLECTGQTSCESVHQMLSPPPISAPLINEIGSAGDLKNNLPIENKQQSSTSTEDGKLIEHQNTDLLYLGPGKPRQPRRCGRPKTAERSRYSGRYSRRSQFSSKCLNNMSADHHSIFRRKARLKELIQQCANEDFMELALPRFTTLVTVSEFLLMKVEKNYPTKALFPEVYREFEELHTIVKKMCQDYLSTPELNNPLAIKNPKVAESLGIIGSDLEMQMVQTIGSSPECIKIADAPVCTEILEQKRATEGSDEMLPFAKKIRAENLLESVTISSSQGEIKERSPAYEGFPPEQNCGANICTENTLQQKEHHKSLELEASNEIADTDQFLQGKAEILQPSSVSGLDCSGYLFSRSERLPLASSESSQEKMVAAYSGNAASGLSVFEICNSTTSKKANQNPSLSEHEESNHNEKYQESQEEARILSLIDCEHPRVSN
ncbi:zinc finger protein 839 isoform X2 [Podarcis raffonei]|uniref:zinc finger protein 839 isoform X2 n=1 Tax=Podarcis raffonei TaxID=65483 RepID=UPI0023299579|nr:zinc finger protein 839 isoform X2 [Podarcis raffonei]